MSHFVVQVAFLFTLAVPFFQSSDASTCHGSATGDYLSVLNVEQFTGCTHVQGNIILNHLSLQGDPSAAIPPMSFDQLFLLSSVEEISGYLQIQDVGHEDFTNLRFLHNLEAIYGQQTLELRPSYNYSLVVEGNEYLRTLNLASLRQVVDGGIRIANNPQLCLVDTISFDDYLVNSRLNRVGPGSSDCSDVQCHEECVPMRGCWGTLPDECVECRNYGYKELCVPQCDLTVSHLNETLGRCLPLAPSSTQASTILGGTTTQRQDMPSVVASDHHTYATTQVQQQKIPRSSYIKSEPTTSPNPSPVTEQTATIISASPMNFPTGTSGPHFIIALSIAPTAGFVCLLALVVIVSRFLLYRSKKTQNLVLKQSRGGSQKKYSEKPQAVKLLKVCNGNQPSSGSDKYDSNLARRTVSLSSLAHGNSDTKDCLCDDHVILKKNHMASCGKNLPQTASSTMRVPPITMTQPQLRSTSNITPPSSYSASAVPRNRHFSDTTHSRQPYRGYLSPTSFSYRTNSVHVPPGVSLQRPLTLGGIYSTRSDGSQHTSTHHYRGPNVPPGSTHLTSTHTNRASYRHSNVSVISSMQTMVSAHGSMGSPPGSPEHVEHSTR